MKTGEAGKGGFTERRAQEVAHRQKRAESLKVGEDEKLKQHLNELENELQDKLQEHADELHDLDRDIQEAKDVFDNSAGEARVKAGEELKKARDAKLAFRVETGIRELERNAIPHAKLVIENEDNRRKRVVATTYQSGVTRFKDFWLSGGVYTKATAKEASHNIRMNAKIEKGGDHGGGDHGASHPAPAHHPAPAAKAPPAADHGDHGTHK
jgi:hypothetical protein